MLTKVYKELMILGALPIRMLYLPPPPGCGSL